MIRGILGKIADKKLELLGFKKTEDCETIVIYERWNKECMFHQILAILRKSNRSAIIQSYDAELTDEKRIGNTCVGLTCSEAVIAAMKIISKRW